MRLPFSTIGETEPNAMLVAVAGLVALAVAMGIGRFAFTPILPMMIADAGLTVTTAGWLAAANYLGYLVGALCAARVPMLYATRGGMVLIAVVTFAMGLTHALVLQMILRLLAGIASAWVLVHVSAWALGHLLALERSDAGGVVFAGVGVGIAVAGLVCMGTMYAGWGSDFTWELFGVLSLVSALLFWQSFSAPIDQPGQSRSATSGRVYWTRDKWRLMACYGAFGFGYIIPATFLPNMAHQYVTDPLVFGLAWPVFGIASAVFTWIAARWLAHMNDRNLWAICHTLMATGVILPVLWTTLASILIAALLVGGTFMIAVMLSLREARRAAGSDATAFIAMMTTAFAIGQIVGPLLVSGVAGWPYGFAAVQAAAAAILMLAAISLWRSTDRAVDYA